MTYAYAMTEGQRCVQLYRVQRLQESSLTPPRPFLPRPFLSDKPGWTKRKSQHAVFLNSRWYLKCLKNCVTFQILFWQYKEIFSYRINIKIKIQTRRVSSRRKCSFYVLYITFIKKFLYNISQNNNPKRRFKYKKFWFNFGIVAWLLHFGTTNVDLPTILRKAINNSHITRNAILIARYSH